MTRYRHVIEVLDNAVKGPSSAMPLRHAFWRWLTREQFIAKKRSGVRLVTVGDGAASPLIRALKGDLPSQAPEIPGVSPEDIAFIEQWINDRCPSDELESIT
jgi:hypothetical protein